MEIWVCFFVYLTSLPFRISIDTFCRSEELEFHSLLKSLLTTSIHSTQLNLHRFHMALQLLSWIYMICETQIHGSSHSWAILLKEKVRRQNSECADYRLG